MSSQKAKIAENDRIPFGQKMACSLGYGMDYLAMGLTTGMLWMPYFNVGLGISPAMLGLVLMVMRIWDAINDPIMGAISDNARTRWGRRRPFVFCGALVTALLYLAIWRIPADSGEGLQLGLLLVIGLLFSTSYTVWSVPYYSLRLELTPDYDERNRLAAWVAIAGKFIYLSGGWVMALATCSWFTDPETGDADFVRGMRAVSIGLAIIIFILGCLPALFVKERYYEKSTSKQKKESTWENLKRSSKCLPLLCFIGVSFFLSIGSTILNTLFQYANIYLVNEGELARASVLNGWKSTAIVIFGLICIPGFVKLGDLFDKKRIVFWMLVFSIIGHLLNLVFLTPERPYLLLVPAVFEYGALGAIWMFAPSMLADISDFDEEVTGIRREGSITAFWGWFSKLALTLGAALGGALVELTGFSADIGKLQPEEVLARIKWFYIGFPVLLWACGLFFLTRYSLTRQKMKEIRVALEKRRGVL